LNNETSSLCREAMKIFYQVVQDNKLLCVSMNEDEADTSGALAALFSGKSVMIIACETDDDVTIVEAALMSLRDYPDTEFSQTDYSTLVRMLTRNERPN
jgi:hypothetical protein